MVLIEAYGLFELLSRGLANIQNSDNGRTSDQNTLRVMNEVADGMVFYDCEEIHSRLNGISR